MNLHRSGHESQERIHPKTMGENCQESEGTRELSPAVQTPESAGNGHRPRRRRRPSERRPVLDRNHPRYDHAREFVEFPDYDVSEIEEIIGWRGDKIRYHLFRPFDVIRREGLHLCQFGWVRLIDSGNTKRRHHKIFLRMRIPYQTLLNYFDGNKVGCDMRDKGGR